MSLCSCSCCRCPLLDILSFCYYLFLFFYFTFSPHTSFFSLEFIWFSFLRSLQSQLANCKFSTNLIECMAKEINLENFDKSPKNSGHLSPLTKSSCKPDLPNSSFPKRLENSRCVFLNFIQISSFTSINVLFLLQV